MSFAIVLVGFAAVLAWAAELWIHARRAEQVLVLRLANGTAVTLARQADGRYEVAGAVGVCVALARFQALRTRERIHRLRAIPAPRMRQARRAAVQPR